ncbi:MAG: hypothetical protein ACE5H9_06445 [Anaerolineae bacterium]
MKKNILALWSHCLTRLGLALLSALASSAIALLLLLSLSVTISRASSPPVITSVAVTSDQPTYLYVVEPLTATEQVYFNSLASGGGGQTITVSVTLSDTGNYSFEGGFAFGSTPISDTTGSGGSYKVVYTIGVNAPSQNNVVFTATDQTTGLTDTVTISFTQDNLAPNKPINFAHVPDADSGGDGFAPHVDDPNNLHWEDDFVIDFTWDAPGDPGGSGVQGYRLSPNDPPSGPIVAEDASYTVATDGPYNFRVAAVDNVGNESASEDLGALVIEVDTDSPIGGVLTLAEISGGEFLFISDATNITTGTMFYNNNSPSSFSVTADNTNWGEGSERWKVVFDPAWGRASFEDETMPYLQTYDISIGETENELTVHFVNQAGNTQALSLTMTQDTTAPSVTLLDVTNPDYDPPPFDDELDSGGNWHKTSNLGGGWAFSFNRDDGGAGIAAIAATWDHQTDDGDDQTLNLPTTATNGTFNNVDDDQDGTITVTVAVTDNVSNVGTAAVPVRLDNTGPEAPLNFQHAGDADSGGDGLAPSPPTSNPTQYYEDDPFINLSWSAASDNGGSGVNHYEIKANNSSFSGSYTGTSAAHNVGGDGIYNLAVRAVDNVGNVDGNNVSNLFGSVIVDQDAPAGGTLNIFESSDYLYIAQTTGLVSGTLYYNSASASSAYSAEADTSALNWQNSGAWQVIFSPAWGQAGVELETAPYSQTYVVDVGENQTNFAVGFANRAGNVYTLTIDTVADTTPPTATLTLANVTAPDYTNGNDYWYRTPALTGGWSFTATAQDGGAGPAAHAAMWDHQSDDANDQTLNLGSSTQGTFPGVSTNSDGQVHLKLTTSDRVSNTATYDLFTIHLDGTPPATPASFTILPDDDTDANPPGYPPAAGYEDDTTLAPQWQATTDAGSGLKTYHLGTAPDPTTGSYAQNAPFDVGSDGVYTLYLTAEDNVGNISADTSAGPVTVDTRAPTMSFVNASPDKTNNLFDVTWGGIDTGDTSLSYEVYYAENGNPQVQWFALTPATSAQFGPNDPVAINVETPYLFTVRAKDRAGHWSDFLASPPQAIGLKITVLPLVLKGFSPTIPVFSNGDFETGTFDGWATGGELNQFISTAEKHSGNFAALLGDPTYSCTSVPVGSAWIKTLVTVPATGTPRLSVWYKIFTYDTVQSATGLWDTFEVLTKGDVALRDGNPENTNLSCSNLRTFGWKQAIIPLTGYKGQTIVIEFHNYNRNDGNYNTYTYVDDIEILP